jgi:hypothetical protein
MKAMLFAVCMGCVSVSAKAEPVEALHDQVFTTIISAIQENPGLEVSLCVERICELYRIDELPRKGGSAETMFERPKGNDEAGSAAGAVSEIIGTVGKSVGVGGRVVIDLETHKDGTIKLHVEASFGTGTGAAAAAGGGQGNTPTATK